MPKKNELTALTRSEYGNTLSEISRMARGGNRRKSRSSRIEVVRQSSKSEKYRRQAEAEDDEEHPTDDAEGLRIQAARGLGDLHGLHAD